MYEVKAGLFKSLAHPIRIHALELLSDGEEHTVSELQQHTGLEASHLSSHLAVLRQNQVVTSQRRASHVYYRVTTPRSPTSPGTASSPRSCTRSIPPRRDLSARPAQ